MINLYICWTYDSPTHPLNGSPVNSSLQVQIKLPTVSVHRVFSPHGLSSHSFMSRKHISYSYYYTQYILSNCKYVNEMPYRCTNFVVYLRCPAVFCLKS
jgi:hypothetical protein